MTRNETIELATWFALLVVICFGLGYPSLNRYNPPTIEGLSDSGQYYRLVEYGPSAALGHWKYRILVPYLAKPVYWVCHGHFASWNPISLALLTINSIFCAASAFLVSLFAYRFTRSPAAAVAASFAYLLTFIVPNYQLSGLVDSADAFFFLSLIWALLHDRWGLLPVIGVLAAVSKETFVPVGARLPAPGC